MHLFPLPLALVVFEKVRFGFGVVEEAGGGDVFLAEAFGQRNSHRAGFRPSGSAEKQALVGFQQIEPNRSQMEAAQPNPITSTSRLWLEWNLTPNVQWAPGSVDPDANPDRTLNVLKLQPVFPFRLNEDWTVLTRTIFRFVLAPSASPELGLTPLGEPLGSWLEPAQPPWFVGCQPDGFLCAQPRL